MKAFALKLPLKSTAINSSDTSPRPKKEVATPFKEILREALKNQDLFGIDKSYRQLESVKSKGTLSTTELLILQGRAAALHLKVELLSKVGESASSSIKKLQQG
jgi:hypothetical protein